MYNQFHHTDKDQLGSIGIIRPIPCYTLPKQAAVKSPTEGLASDTANNMANNMADSMTNNMADNSGVSATSENGTAGKTHSGKKDSDTSGYEFDDDCDRADNKLDTGTTPEQDAAHLKHVNDHDKNEVFTIIELEDSFDSDGSIDSVLQNIQDLSSRILTTKLADAGKHV